MKHAPTLAQDMNSRCFFSHARMMSRGPTLDGGFALSRFAHSWCPSASAELRIRQVSWRFRVISGGGRLRILRQAARLPLYRRMNPMPKLPFGPGLPRVATLSELPARKRRSLCSLERLCAGACQPRTGRRTRRADHRQSDTPIRRLRHTLTMVPDRSRRESDRLGRTMISICRSCEPAVRKSVPNSKARRLLPLQCPLLGRRPFRPRLRHEQA